MKTSKAIPWSDFVTCIVLFSTLVKTSSSLRIANRPSSHEEPVLAYGTKITVELLVVCDKDFSEIFHHDRQKIVDYWAIQLWDINMRFRTLTKSDITFKLHQLIAYNNTEEQTLIEEARNSSGAVSLQQTLKAFAKWSYTHQSQLTKFDVAVVALGADKHEMHSNSWAFDRAAACKTDRAVKKIYSAVVVHFGNVWGGICGAVARPLSHLLGAHPDSYNKLNSDCKDKGYLRDNDVCGKNQFFFSKCSDDEIAKYVYSQKAFCLHSDNSSIDDMIASNASVTHPPSILEQCKLLTNNTSAVVAEDDDICVSAKCLVPENGNLTVAATLYPFDNSPCDNNKFCFRGRCLPRGFPLRKVGANKCLLSSDRFSSNDSAVLQKCVTLPTPLDQFIMLDNGSPENNFLATPYSTADGSENADKCLTYNPEEMKLQYSKCMLEDEITLSWRIIELYETTGEFLLLHSYTGNCVFGSHYKVFFTNDMYYKTSYYKVIYYKTKGHILQISFFMN